MKPNCFILFMAFICFEVISFAQMKRPNIMVVPSDAWCIHNGYYTSFDDYGVSKEIPDYRKALQNDSEMRSLINSLGHMMESYDFPLRDLEQVLKKIEKDEAEQILTVSRSTGETIAENPMDLLHSTAKCDIVIDVDYRKTQNGPFSRVTLIIKALDPYSSQNIASCPPAVTEQVTAPIELLLNSAVQDIKTILCPGIMKHFEDTYENGRQARIFIKRFDGCSFDFESEVPYGDTTAELGEVIEQWLSDNCIGGVYNVDDSSEDSIDINPARIPVRDISLGGKERAVEAVDFARKLRKYLMDQYSIDSKVIRKGLGEAWVILGDK